MERFSFTPPFKKSVYVMIPSANSCITRPVAARKPTRILILKVTAYITPSIKEWMAIPSAATIPNASTSFLVIFFIRLFEKNINKKPNSAINPA